MAKGQIFKDTRSEDEAKCLQDFQEIFKGKSGAEDPFKSTGPLTYLHAFENPRRICISVRRMNLIISPMMALTCSQQPALPTYF